MIIDDDDDDDCQHHVLSVTQLWKWELMHWQCQTMESVFVMCEDRIVLSQIPSAALVSPGQYDILTCLTAVDVLNHAVSFEVCELYRECLESVALWDVVFDSFLELF